MFIYHNTNITRIIYKYWMRICDLECLRSSAFYTYFNEISLVILWIPCLNKSSNWFEISGNFDKDPLLFHVKCWSYGFWLWSRVSFLLEETKCLSRSNSQTEICWTLKGKGGDLSLADMWLSASSLFDLEMFSFEGALKEIIYLGVKGSFVYPNRPNYGARNCKRGSTSWNFLLFTFLPFSCRIMIGPFILTNEKLVIFSRDTFTIPV